MTCTAKTRVRAEMSSRDLLNNPVRYGVIVGLAAITAGFASIGLWLVIG